MNNNLTDTFTALVAGNLTEAAWLAWFEENKSSVEAACGRIAFLKIKPMEGQSDIANTYRAQKGVHEWLKIKGNELVLSKRYFDAYEQSLKDYARKVKETRKAAQSSMADNIGYLKDVYPRFYKQWLLSFDEEAMLEKGVTEDMIKDKETDLSIAFTKELRNFYSNISRIRFEGIDIDFSELSTETINERLLLCMGEFWLYDDGDQLLYDVTSSEVFSYVDGRLTKIAGNMEYLMEKVFVKYLKSYAD